MKERVYVDRIEGEHARMVCGPEGRDRLTIPARLLPAGTQEGAALDLTLAPAPDDPTRQEVQALMDDLFQT